MEIAIVQAREYGLLGKNIFDSGFDFDIQLRLGAGAFVCGEETALMTSIEGKRGEPRPRPPYPAVKGLFGKPSILNNVETYANIAQIILHGAEWFLSLIHISLEFAPVLKLSQNLEEAMQMMEEIDVICEGLPGLDCGSCGAPSCRALAEDVVRGAARTSDCVFVMREQVKNVADTLSSIGGYVPSYLDSKEKQGN